MTATYPGKLFAANELQIGDVIRVYEGTWGTAIVKNVTEESVFIFRPYGTHVDFTTTNGVICLMGLEEYSIPRSDRNHYHVYQREDFVL